MGERIQVSYFNANEGLVVLKEPPKPCTIATIATAMATAITVCSMALAIDLLLKNWPMRRNILERSVIAMKDVFPVYSYSKSTKTVFQIHLMFLRPFSFNFQRSF